MLTKAIGINSFEICISYHPNNAASAEAIKRFNKDPSKAYPITEAKQGLRRAPEAYPINHDASQRRDYSQRRDPKEYQINNTEPEAEQSLRQALKAYIHNAASPEDLRKALEVYPIQTVTNPETDEGLRKDPKASNNNNIVSFSTVQGTIIPFKAHPINTATKPRAVRGLGRDSTEYQINNNAKAVQSLRRASKAHPFTIVTNPEAVQRDPQACNKDSREYQIYNTAGASQGFNRAPKAYPFNSDAFPEAAQCLNREPKAYQTNNTTEAAQGLRTAPNRNDHSNAAAGIPCLYEITILPPMYVDTGAVALENETSRLSGIRLRERDAAVAHGNETRRSMEIKRTERDEAFTRESQKRRLAEMRLVLEKDVAIARGNLIIRLTEMKPSKSVACARENEMRRSNERG
ncbi:predicted protein [Chaetoceros tenuissimus]|uniref:Uncharacterized protein n=1 Tax=Chaetoceros tenuissimus TaxID=426638 RepID=A0AAD3CGA4_9STRA|nr:predicted protein [Chaetoceros tenuissimus]